MKHFRGFRRDWVPITVFLIGMTLAAVAVSVVLLHMVGVNFS